MTETSPKLEEMKRYLFREMPDEESDAVEERIFSDSEFYYELTELENDLVDRYVSGKIRGADLERFERSLKLLPKRREKIANANALQSVIAEERVVGTAPVKQGWWEKITDLFNLRFSGLQLAAGALAVLIVCVGGFLIYTNRQSQNEFAELEKSREAETIEKENLRAQKLEEQRRQNEVNNQLLENGNTSGIGNGLNTNKNINNEIEKLRKDIEDLQQKKDIPSRNQNEIKPSTPYLAVAISSIGRGGAGDEPKAELQTLKGKQVVKITKPLPEDKNYGSYEVVANGKTIETKNITEGAKTIVFYLSTEIKDFEIKAAEHATRGGSESLGIYELKLTKKP